VFAVEEICGMAKGEREEKERTHEALVSMLSQTAHTPTSHLCTMFQTLNKCSLKAAWCHILESSKASAMADLFQRACSMQNGKRVPPEIGILLLNTPVLSRERVLR
jgi:hypothetical protein